MSVYHKLGTGFSFPYPGEEQEIAISIRTSKEGGWCGGLLYTVASRYVVIEGLEVG